MHKGQFYGPDGSGGGGTPSADDKAKGAEDATRQLVEANARIAELERQKSALEKDVHKEREGKKRTDDEAKAIAEKAEAGKKAALDALRAMGIEIPGQDPAAEVAAKLKAIEDEKRKLVESQRDAEIARLRIDRALIKALAGKVEDLDYALYRASLTEAFAAVKLDGDRVSGIDAVIEELSKAGIVKGPDDGDGAGAAKDPKKAPDNGGQPDLQGKKYPWREAKDWAAFLNLPWAQQQEARQKDGDWVKKLEETHFRK